MGEASKTTENESLPRCLEQEREQFAWGKRQEMMETRGNDTSAQFPRLRPYQRGAKVAGRRSARQEAPVVPLGKAMRTNPRLQKPVGFSSFAHTNYEG